MTPHWRSAFLVLYLPIYGYPLYQIKSSCSFLFARHFEIFSYLQILLNMKVLCLPSAKGYLALHWTAHGVLVRRVELLQVAP